MTRKVNMVFIILRGFENIRSSSVKAISDYDFVSVFGTPEEPLYEVRCYPSAYLVSKNTRHGMRLEEKSRFSY